jgi:hypothetical protein
MSPTGTAPATRIRLQPIRFWMFVAFLHGLGVLAGALMAIVHLLTLRPAAGAAPPSVEGARVA